MIKLRREYPLDIYKLLLGLFVFLSPWLFAFPYAPARLDSTVSGGLVVVVSIAALVAFANWKEWTALVLGLWLVVSPWVLGFPNASAMKIHVGAGLCWSIWLLSNFGSSTLMIRTELTVSNAPTIVAAW
jgi:SPW repeat